MKTTINLLVGILLALAYVWAVREAYLFMYVESCLDAGGVIGSAGLCSGLNLAEAQDLGVNAPPVFWLMLLGLPAIFVWGAYRLLVLMGSAAGTPGKASRNR